MRLYCSLLIAILVSYARGLVHVSDRELVFWNNCKHPPCVASVKNVSLSPNPPRRGEPLKIVTELVVSQEVSSGQIIIEVWDEGERVVYQNMSLCSFTNDKGLPCPITKGRHEIPYKLTSFYPRGEYTGKISAFDSSDNILCVDFKLQIYS